MNAKSIIRCSILILSMLLVFSVLPAAADHQPGFFNGCIAEADNLNNPSCTANDVRLTSIVPGSLVISPGKGCDGNGDTCFDASSEEMILKDSCSADDNAAGNCGVSCTGANGTQGTCSVGQVCRDTVTFSATGQFVTGPAQRYDVGLFMETSYGNQLNKQGVYDGARDGQCERFAFFTDPPGFPDVDGDTCADVRSTPSGSGLPPVPADFGPVTIPCADFFTANPSNPGDPIIGSDGLVDINHCESWGNGEDEVPTQNSDCTDSSTVLAGTGSKCFCGLLSGACIAFPSTNNCVSNVCLGNCQPESGTGGSNTVCADNTDCTVDGETCLNIHLQQIPSDQVAYCDAGDTNCTNYTCDPAGSPGSLASSCDTVPTTGACDPFPDFCCIAETGTCSTTEPGCFPSEAICRTPQFWGTHADDQKRNSQNITQTLIDECGSLDVCGECINSTVPIDDAASAIEAMCVSPQGAQELQLARQLTAMALNCCITNGNADCAGDSDWEDVFDFCNYGVCEGQIPEAQTPEWYSICVAALDCLNTGGILGDIVDSSVECQTGTCSNGDPCGRNLPSCADFSDCTPLQNTCHDRDLVNDYLGIDFSVPGPAGSDRACNAAIKNDCTVIGPDESSCDTDSCE